MTTHYTGEDALAFASWGFISPVTAGKAVRRIVPDPVAFVYSRQPHATTLIYGLAPH